MKQLYLILFVFLLLNKVRSQAVESDNYIAWSSTRKLSVNDFIIKPQNLQTSASSAQFSMQFEMGGFAFIKKNFNKNVRNYFIKSASWIDTSFDIRLSIRYQQTLFDICEVYTRNFRKELKANKKKIIKGTAFVNELNAKAMADFAKRRMDYDIETKSGTDEEKQVVWEKLIRKEIVELSEFSNE